MSIFDKKDSVSRGVFPSLTYRSQESYPQTAHSIDAIVDQRVREWQLQQEIEKNRNSGPKQGG